MSKQKSQTYMLGAVILVISNIIVKLIGAVFRIPLTSIIGVEGMAYFNAAYSIYVMFYTVSTAGLPVAISRMISSANSSGNYKQINKIFNISLTLFFVIGALGTSVMLLFSKQFAQYSEMSKAYLAIMAIAPTVFFICVSSAFRGYFQGLQNMIPTAVSQVIEAVGKLGIGLFAAWYFTRVVKQQIHVVAAYVISGVSIGVALATLYILVVKFRHRLTSETKSVLESNVIEAQSSKTILKCLIMTAIPITLSSSIMGLTSIADTFLMANRLVFAGLEETVAASYYGTYSAMVIPLLNLVPPFIYPFGISAIPAISAAISVGDLKKAYSNIDSAFRNCAIIALPCAIGMAVLSKGILSVVFKHETVGNTTTLDLAAPSLSIVALSILFLGLISITNAVLQAWGKEKLTLFSTASGIIVKIILTWALSGISELGIMGSAIGTLLCYFTITAVNIYFVVKYTKYIPGLKNVFFKPLVSGLLCGLTAFICNYALTRVGISIKLSTLVSIVFAAAVYLFVLLALKGINREDVLMMPKGQKICNIMEKLNILEKAENNDR